VSNHAEINMSTEAQPTIANPESPNTVVQQAAATPEPATERVSVQCLAQMRDAIKRDRAEQARLEGIVALLRNADAKARHGIVSLLKVDIGVTADNPAPWSPIALHRLKARARAYGESAMLTESVVGVVQQITEAADHLGASPELLDDAVAPVLARWHTARKRALRVTNRQFQPGRITARMQRAATLIDLRALQAQQRLVSAVSAAVETVLASGDRIDALVSKVGQRSAEAVDAWVTNARDVVAKLQHGVHVFMELARARLAADSARIEAGIQTWRATVKDLPEKARALAQRQIVRTEQRLFLVRIGMTRSIEDGINAFKTEVRGRRDLLHYAVKTRVAEAALRAAQRAIDMAEGLKATRPKLPLPPSGGTPASPEQVPRHMRSFTM